MRLRADSAPVIAERLDQLHVAPRTGGRDLDAHATKIAGIPLNSRITAMSEDVPPQGVLEKRQKTPTRPRLAPSRQPENVAQPSSCAEPIPPNKSNASGQSKNSIVRTPLGSAMCQRENMRLGFLLKRLCFQEFNDCSDVAFKRVTSNTEIRYSNVQGKHL